VDKVVHVEEGKEDGARAQVVRGEAQGLRPTGPLLRPACHPNLLRAKQATCIDASAAAIRRVAVVTANSSAVCMC